MDKQMYRLYGKIRYMVEDDHCSCLTAKQVREKINKKHYELINKYYGLEEKEVNEIIDYVIKYTPPIEKSKSIKGT